MNKAVFLDLVRARIALLPVPFDFVLKMILPGHAWPEGVSPTTGGGWFGRAVDDGQIGGVIRGMIRPNGKRVWTKIG